MIKSHKSVRIRSAKKNLVDKLERPSYTIATAKKSFGDFGYFYRSKSKSTLGHLRQKN